MNLVYFTKRDIQLKELDTIGLAANGQLLLNLND
jgi:hypothetical protein